MRRFRHLVIIVCVAAAVLLQRSEHTLLFGFAALVAFTNLFSSQFVCALDGCRANAVSGSWRDPARIARLIYHTTGAVGTLLFAYAVVDLYR